MALLRKIPEKVSAKLKSISSSSVIVACAVNLTKKEINELDLSRIGILIKSGKLVVPNNNVFPDASFGPVANENINGKELVDKKSPKVLKEIYLGDRPIYGDWGKGSFSLWQTRKVYRKTFVQPKAFSLNIACRNAEGSNDSWKLSFSITPTIERKKANFESTLIFALSLLKEIIGRYDVFPSNTTPDEIAETYVVSWDIFPPGKRDLKTELARRMRMSDEKNKKIILNRAGTLESLRPEKFILGAGLASNYYGALFADDLVVFENLDYGNATYILYDDWKKLSKLSRTELLNGQENFDRVIHDSNWASNIKEFVKHGIEIRKKRSRRR